MLFIAAKHPQRRHQSRPRSAAAAGGAKRRAFTDAGAEGTAREREKARLATTFNEKPRLKTIKPDKASSTPRRHGMSLSEPFPPWLAGFHCDAHCRLKSTSVRQDKPLEQNGI
jgi:hypothetical protein